MFTNYFHIFTGIVSSVKLQECTEETQKKVKSISMHSLDSSTSTIFRNAVSHPNLRDNNTEQSINKYKWWESQEFNLASSINIFDESTATKRLNDMDKYHKNVIIEEGEEIKKEKKTITTKIVEFFDLTLLKDPIFVNILLGLSIAACVETNFSLLLPIILKDLLQFETSQIAQVMAVIGFSDTIFRLAAPFIGEWCHKPPRIMYMLSLLMIVLTRTGKLYS